MKKILIILTILGIVIISGCNSSTQTGNTNNELDTGTPPEGEIKEFTMTAKQFEFTPSTITVNQGDLVKLTITSTDVAHGISIPDFDINENISPDQITTIEFIADKTGTFTFSCSVYCGSNHNEMEGTLIVE